MRGRFDCAVTHMSADQMILGQTRRSHKVPVLRYIQNLSSNTTRPGRGLLLRNAGALGPERRPRGAAHLSGFPQARIGILRGAIDLERFQPGAHGAFDAR